MKETMAKAKRSTGKKKKKVKKDAYVQAIIVIIFSLVLAVLIYGKTGTLGVGLSKVLGGLVGWIKYIIPVGVFIVGIVLTKEQKELVIPKLVQFSIIILAICGTMSLGQISKDVINSNADFGEIINSAYDLGERNKGGGAIRSINCCATKQHNRCCILCSINWNSHTSFNIHIWN